MTQSQTSIVKARHFSLNFERMCNFAAISEFQASDETLRQLICQCFAIFPPESLGNAKQIGKAIEDKYGLRFHDYQIQNGIDYLVDHSKLLNLGSNYCLPLEERAKLLKRIEESKKFGEEVKQNWFEELSKTYSTLSPDKAWDALQFYLTGAFKRHGIQAIALLDPTVTISPEYTLSLTSILDQAVKNVFPSEDVPTAKNALSNFLATVGQDPKRSIYIAQLADGAFNFFSLAVAPDVAEQFRKRLNNLVLFLDTNFLFGILDLHTHPNVEVSNELLNAIQKYHLPFLLRYHEATDREMKNTLEYYSEILHKCKWPIGMSRAAVTSRNLSGIERKYHEKHIETGIDVDSFLKPFDHIDVLLNEKNIKIYRTHRERLEERATLEQLYSDFLETKGQEKSRDAIMHDIRVLDTVRQQRSTSNSTLDAGALLVTCDYYLYKFDSETSRSANSVGCVVLPNLFWQILRPYIPMDTDFDQAFAQTFAIPEFRTISSGATKACTKMLSILGSYTDFPEETAAKLLSNDLLIERFRNAKSDEECHEYIQSQLVEENTLLQQEKSELEKKLQKEKSHQKKEMDQLKEEYENKIQALEQVLAQTATYTEEKISTPPIPPIDANLEKLEKRADINGVIAGVFLGISLFLLARYFIFKYNWKWLLQHPFSYSLQGSVFIFFVLLMVGIFVAKWRKGLWGIGVFSIITTILQLLGGPKP